MTISNKDSNPIIYDYNYAACDLNSIFYNF